MEEKFYDRLKDWLHVDSLDNLDKYNLSVSKVYSFDEDDYHQRIFLVTEKKYDNMLEVGIIRMFGCGDNVCLSVDYRDETITYDDLFKKIGHIVEVIIMKSDK